MVRTSNALLLLTLLFLCSGNALAQHSWYQYSPLPQGNRLNDVIFTDADSGTAVGEGGTIVRTTNGGRTWTVQESGTVRDLLAVSFSDPRNGTVVGVYGTILRTTNGGTTWTPQTSFRVEHYTDVSFTDVNNGFIVGDGTVLRTTNGGANWLLVTTGMEAEHVSFADSLTGTVVRGSTVHRTTDGGANWVRQFTGSSGRIWDVSFFDVNTGMMVGEQGTVFYTSNGGRVWRPRQTGVGDVYTSVSLVDARTATVVGAGGTILRTTDGGETWTHQKLGPYDAFFGVSFADTNNGTITGQEGAILHTTDGGVTWERQTKWTLNWLSALSFPDAGTGTVAGARGTILRTTDSGATWKEQSSGTSRWLSGVSFTDAGNGTIVGDSGIILRTTNGGATWARQISGVTEWLTCVSFVDVRSGIAAGRAGVILRTSNGGATWARQTSGTTESISGMHFIDASTGTMVGTTGTILRTTNGGASWIPQTSGVTHSLSGVYFTDADTGTIAGNGGTILRTTNGGATWTPQTSGTTNNLYAVSFSDARNGTVAGAYGTILGTTDGGETWFSERNRNSWSLNAVTLTDGIGTAVGQGGHIFRTIPIPSIPDAAVTLTSFHGDTYVAGSTADVSWTSSGVDSIRIELSSDGGTTFPTVIVASTPADSGAYAWAIPPGQPIGSTYRIRISDVDNPMIADTSSKDFTITNEVPASLLLTSFNGGSYAAGTTQTIAWTTTGVDSLRIELSSDSGTSFSTTISSGTPTVSGGFIWSIPADQPAGSGYRIRISDLSNPSISDISDTSFTITREPEITAQVTMGRINAGDPSAWHNKLVLVPLVVVSRTEPSTCTPDSVSFTFRIRKTLFLPSIEATAARVSWMVAADDPAQYEVTVVGRVQALAKAGDTVAGISGWVLGGDTTTTPITLLACSTWSRPPVTGTGSCNVTMRLVPGGYLTITPGSRGHDGERLFAWPSTHWKLVGLYPNPATPSGATLEVESEGDRQVTIRVVSTLGKELVRRDGIALRSGVNVIELSLFEIETNGAYQLIVESPEGQAAIPLVIRR
jgi:photosystem II stability/assembly factor-like uncharacterized protein